VTAVVAGLVLVVAVLGVLVVGLLRSHAEVLRALHDLGVDLDPARADGTSLRSARVDLLPGPTPGRPGEEASVPTAVVGLDPTGGSVSVALVGERRLTLLGFLSSGCLTCRPMWEGMGDRAAELPGGARPVAVTKGPHEESPASVQALAAPHLATMMSSEAWSDFAVPGSPYFVLVDGAGRVLGEGTAGTWDRVLELLGQAMADSREFASGRRFDGGATGRPEVTGQRAADRYQYVDDTLRAAGIEAGDPSLYPGPAEEAG